MKQEDLELLVTDLCERFPYTVYVRYNDKNMKIIDINYSRDEVFFTLLDDTKTYLGVSADRFQPYLRSAKFITEDDQKEMDTLNETFRNHLGMEIKLPTHKTYDFMNKKHYDFRGLIPLGLALIAPSWMYK